MEKRNNKKRNKGNNNEENDNKDNVDYEKLKEELDCFLKVNEEISKVKDKESEAIKKVRNQAIEKLKEFKDFKEEKKIDEMYNIGVETIKTLSNTESTNVTNKNKIDQQTKEINLLNDQNNTLTNKLAQADKYSKMLLDKCNQLNEEKKKLVIEETEKRNELIKKCEDFMKDMQSKFEKEIPEKEMLIKENEDLRKKLDETKVIIEEKLDIAQKSKQMYEETIKNGLEVKLKELMEKDNIQAIENQHLKSQLTLYNSKFDDLSKSIQSYTSTYETLKKEFDKVSFLVFKVILFYYFRGMLKMPF